MKAMGEAGMVMGTTTTTDGITVIHGDALEVMAGMEDGSVDAIVTDPPYGTKVERDGYGRRQIYNGEQHIEGDADLGCVEHLFAHAPRLLKPGGWLACFCSPKRRFEVESLCRAAGIPVRGEVVWDKRRPGLGGGIRYQHETVLLCNGKAGRDSLLSVIGELNSRETGNRHPHEKPVRLMAALVRYCSRRGDLVLDPFAGSGATLVACRKSGRKAIGIEVDSAYIPVIRRRLAAAATPLFDGLDANGEGESR